LQPFLARLLHRGVHGRESAETMLASGTEHDENTAMVSARRAAMRISSMLAERKKQRLEAGVPVLHYTP